MKTLLPILLVTLIMASCANPQKLLEKGQYDKALEVSLKRLENGNTKFKYIDALEVSFEQVTYQDSLLVEAWRQEGQSQVWPSVYEKAQEIKSRQQQVEHVARKIGYSPDVDNYPAEALIEEAAYKSALYYYAQAQAYLIPARKGDRQAARQAFYFLEKCNGYQSNFKDALALENEMYNLGITHILIETQETRSSVDNEIYRRVFNNESTFHKNGWQIYHLQENAEQNYHYRGEVFLDNFYVSSDQVSTSTCTESKEVEDGYTEKQEWSAQDSAYVTVREKKYKIISATVTTYTQYKSAQLNLKYRLWDTATNELWNEGQISGYDSWSNEYTSVAGDSEALSLSCSTVIGFCQMFPSDRDLLLGAASGFRRRLFDVWSRLE